MAASVLALGAGLTGSALAQGGFAGGIADPASLDTLSGASTGSAAGNIALDRARALQQPGGAQDPFGPDPGAGGGDPFGSGGGGAAGGPPGGGGGLPGFGGGDGGGFGAAFGGGALDNQPGGGGLNLPKVSALYGTRIYCRVTGEMLNDAHEVQISAAFKNQYYDDGVHGMDAVANDLKFTNVSVRRDVMSPEAGLVRTRVIRALETAELLEPHDFFNVRVASTDPLADVPKMLQLEQDRDEKLKTWAEHFLRDFRVDPDGTDQGNWDFYETYLVPPPRVPESLIPASFFPPTSGGATNGGANGNGPNSGDLGASAREGLGNAFGTNNIQNNPGASSSYFGGAPPALPPP
ncbi:hypothetical protein HZA57_06550 [Candidatus Poribacteria bacterium]|nr:hypothetical protein [Candidatus Poribacteria bacterium]